LKVQEDTLKRAPIKNEEEKKQTKTSLPLDINKFYSNGVPCILRLMKKSDIKRLVFLSYSATNTNVELKQTEEVVQDKETKVHIMIQTTKELNWTVMLVPKIIFNRPKTCKYRFQSGEIPKDGTEIGVGDLCHYCYVVLHASQTHNKFMGCAL